MTPDLADIRSGGPPPDGIPSIDEPVFLRPADVDFLADNEPVLALEIDGDARAYPVQILTWHEIVNDTVGGVPEVPADSLERLREFGARLARGDDPTSADRQR